MAGGIREDDISADADPVVDTTEVGCRVAAVLAVCAQEAGTLAVAGRAFQACRFQAAEQDGRQHPAREVACQGGCQVYRFQATERDGRRGRPLQAGRQDGCRVVPSLVGRVLVRGASNRRASWGEVDFAGSHLPGCSDE